jgi:hypothetical protein
MREAIEGSMTLPKLDGVEIRPDVWIIGEPTPILGTDKLRALTNYRGALALVELRISFHEQKNAEPPK